MRRPTPPRPTKAPAPRRKSSSRVETPSRGSVLVVDDHADTREMLFTILKTEGYDVALAEDGDQGLQSYRLRPADVVLLDMVMPRKDGLATIRELHIEFPDVTILAMSGDTGGGFRDVLAEAREAGAHLTLRKPLEPWVLLRALEGLVLGRRSQAAAGLHRTA
jgi:CheY-like chemotaxis protein